MSDDGERVAYVAPNRLADNFSSLQWADYNVFVKDFAAGQTIVASLGADGEMLTAEGGFPGQLDYRLSGDGRKVAFITNLPGVTPDTPDLGIDQAYVRDLDGGTTTLVTAGGTIPEAGGEFVYSLEISRDGRYVLFATDRNFSGLPDLNGSVEEPESDVYVRDLQTGAVRLVSGNAAGTGEVGGYAPDMSADGRYVVYETANPYSTPDDVDFGTSVVLRDLVAGGTLLLNRRPDGTIFDWTDDANFDRVVSASGNLLVFTSFTHDVGVNFAPGIIDANGTAEDVLAMPLAGISQPALTPPAASTGLLPTVVDTGAATYEFDVTFSDAQFIDSFAVEGDEIVVTGPGGFRQAATIVTYPPDDVAKAITFRYSVAAPGGTFGPEDDGLYTIEVLPDQVRATSGLAVPGGPVVNGVFGVDIPLPNGPDLEATALTGAVPTSVMSGPGARQKLKPLTFRVTNSGNQPADGVVTVRLVASSDAVASPNDPVVAELPNQKLKLAPGKSKTFKLKPAAFPAVADGDYHLFAIVDAGGAMTERRELNNSAGLGTPVRIAAANSDIGIASPTLSGRLAPGKKATVLVSTTNGGNVIAKGVQPVRVRFTTNPSDANAVSRTIDTSLKLSLKPGATRALRAKLTLPADLPAGSYFVLVELLSGAPWSDPNAANNVASSAGAYAV
jgi:hypothetical protein